MKRMIRPWMGCMDVELGRRKHGWPFTMVFFSNSKMLITLVISRSIENKGSLQTFNSWYTWSTSLHYGTNQMANYGEDT